VDENVALDQRIWRKNIASLTLYLKGNYGLQMKMMMMMMTHNYTSPNIFNNDQLLLLYSAST